MEKKNVNLCWGEKKETLRSLAKMLREWHLAAGHSEHGGHEASEMPIMTFTITFSCDFLEKRVKTTETEGLGYVGAFPLIKLWLRRTTAWGQFLFSLIRKWGGGGRGHTHVVEQSWWTDGCNACPLTSRRKVKPPLIASRSRCRSQHLKHCSLAPGPPTPCVALEPPRTKATLHINYSAEAVKWSRFKRKTAAWKILDCDRHVIKMWELDLPQISSKVSS